MVNVTPKVPAEIAGCLSFGFKSHYSVRESSNLDIRALHSQILQCGRIKALLASFTVLPSEVTLQVGVEAGHTVIEGELYPYEATTMEKVMRLLAEIDAATMQFSRNYPASRFVIRCSQTITFTRVDRQENSVKQD